MCINQSFVDVCWIVIDVFNLAVSNEVIVNNFGTNIFESLFVLTIFFLMRHLYFPLNKVSQFKNKHFQHERSKINEFLNVRSKYWTVYNFLISQTSFACYRKKIKTLAQISTDYWTIFYDLSDCTTRIRKAHYFRPEKRVLEKMSHSRKFAGSEVRKVDGSENGLNSLLQPFTCEISITTSGSCDAIALEPIRPFFQNYFRFWADSKFTESESFCFGVYVREKEIFAMFEFCIWAMHFAHADIYIMKGDKQWQLLDVLMKTIFTKWSTF